MERDINVEWEYMYVFYAWTGREGDTAVLDCLGGKLDLCWGGGVDEWIVGGCGLTMEW